jgi:hypothetical protein
VHDRVPATQGGAVAVQVDYYTRLEQARGPHPSRQVLAALARTTSPSGVRTASASSTRRSACSSWTARCC